MSSSFQFGAKYGSPASGNSFFDRCRHSPGRKIIVSFTTKYALPRQIKPRILELSIRRRQSNSSIALTFVVCDDVSAGLGATTARTNHFFAFFFFFSIFELGGITKHFMTGVLFPRDLNIH